MHQKNVRKLQGAGSLATHVTLRSTRHDFLGINECSTNTNDCDKNAICKDTDVAFSCTCKLGYKGDGLKCIG